MSRMDHFRQGGTPYDGFLYADLGQDRAGNTVSVLSALARLGHDPWDKAADLSVMPTAGARNLLADILARFQDVPACRSDSAAIVARLVALLPSSSQSRSR